MSRTKTAFAAAALALAAPALSQAPAFAGEADDLQVMIERARRNAEDLKRLDEQRAVTDEITLVGEWLNEAWRFRSEQKYDEVRLVLDRVDAQADMIRERITAARLAAQAAAKEDALRKAKTKIEKTRQEIQATLMQKAALEGKVK